MFLDNAASHSHELRFSHVQLKFLPANITSVLQPLDQGIIREFKARYRKLMIKSLLSKIEQTESASELCKDISILGVIYWISKAWNDTKNITIEKCFRLAGFSTDNNNVASYETDETEDDDEDDIPLIQLARQLRELPQEYDFNFDATIPTEEDSTEWEKDLLGPYQRDETIVCEQKEEEELEEEKLFTMSELETLPQVRKIHAETTADFIRPLTGDIIMRLEYPLVRKKCRTTQSTIDMFFKQ